MLVAIAFGGIGFISSFWELLCCCCLRAICLQDNSQIALFSFNWFFSQLFWWHRFSPVASEVVQNAILHSLFLPSSILFLAVHPYTSALYWFMNFLISCWWWHLQYLTQNDSSSLSTQYGQKLTPWISFEASFPF